MFDACCWGKIAKASFFGFLLLYNKLPQNSSLNHNHLLFLKILWIGDLDDSSCDWGHMIIFMWWLDWGWKPSMSSLVLLVIETGRQLGHLVSPTPGLLFGETRFIQGLVVSGFQEREKWKLSDFWRPSPRSHTYYFYCILLVKASHRASPDSSKGKWTPSLNEKRTKTQNKGALRWEELWLFLQTVYHRGQGSDVLLR